MKITSRNGRLVFLKRKREREKRRERRREDCSGAQCQRGVKQQEQQKSETAEARPNHSPLLPLLFFLPSCFSFVSHLEPLGLTRFWFGFSPLPLPRNTSISSLGLCRQTKERESGERKRERETCAMSQLRLALFFTFLFQVQGELVVQSDNVSS